MKKAKNRTGRNAAIRKRRQGGKGRPFRKGPDERRNTAGQRSKAAVETTKKIRAELVTEGDRENSCKIKMPDGKEKIFRGKNYELLAQVIWRQAVSGDYQFVSLILDRIEGKVPMPIQGADDDKPVLIKIVPAAGVKR